MSAPTVRRRRRPPTNSPSTTTQDDTTSTQTPAAPTLSDTAKAVPDIIEEERQAMSSFLAIAMAVIAIFVYMIITTKLPPEGRVYGIMIDAGSTGTRAQVFAFHEDPSAGRLVLDSTKMFTIKKSLASLAMDPGAMGKDFFKPLLDNVKKTIPGVRRRRVTPISLHATAGLRLLGIERSERALEQARVALRESEFLFEDSWVSILDDVQEAVHGWTTVNYLTGKLHGRNEKDVEKKFVGTMELGGASMQLAFQSDGSVPSVDEGSKNNPHAASWVGSISEVKVFGQSYNVYAKSQLGMGLFDFTKKLYLLFEQEGVLDIGNPCFRKGKLFENKKLRLGVPGSEESKTITTTGDGDFARCVASAELVIGSFGGIQAVESEMASGNTFYAFAYFYDRTVKLGLPANPIKEELVAKGKRLCESSPDMEIEEDFDEACAEFSYIYAIVKDLTDDFSPSRKISIRFEQFVGEHMLGWALGAMLDTLEAVKHKQLALDHAPLIN